MIEVTTNLKRANAFDKAQAIRPKFRTLNPSKILIIPREPEHRPTVVTFDKDGRAIFATCRYRGTSEACPANAHGQWCFHVAWATIQIVKQQRKDSK